ncbi:MAG: tetratricopeptide repeat-containing sensor histidine kinase [Bacteroidetes bacterium]|nr:tetratricopeptide repeat-containing sensor histidine kinase [Bacteroidota bacterium]
MSSLKKEKIDSLVSQILALKDAANQTTLIKAEEIINLSKEINYDKGMACGHFHKGYATYKMSNYVSARYSLVESVKHYEKINDELGIAAAENIIGQTYYFEGEFDKALEHNSKSLELRSKHNQLNGVAHNYNNYANIYLSLGDNPSAVEYYQKALTIFQELNDEYAMGMVYNNMGALHFRLNEYDKALELFNNTMEIAGKVNHKHLYSTSLNNIANIYHDQGRYEESIEIDLKALELQRQIGDRYGEALSLGNLGSTYNDMDINDKAIDCLTESISMRQTIGDKTGEAEASLELGKLYKKLNKPSRAKTFIENSIAIGESLKLYNHLSVCHTVYSELFEQIGEFDKALEQFKLHYKYWKEVFSEESDKKIKNLQVLYEVDKQKKETEIYRLKNIELAELNMEKNEFLGIAAHDLKNPLTGIILNTSTIRRNIDKFSKEDVLKRIGKIELTAERMQLIIKNMLDINAIEEGRLNLHYEEFDIKLLLKKIIEDFTTAASQKEIKINFESGEDKVLLTTDGSSLTEIIENLLSNAIKYSPNGKTVHVKCFKENESAVIEIKDEGLGFTDEDKKSVFHKFARLSAKPTGGEHSTGLGLSIVKKLTDILGGEVTFESEPNKGSTFRLTFKAS